MVVDGPDWQIIATGSISIIVLMVAAYVKGLNGRVEDLESDFIKLQALLLKDYHTKDEIKELLSDLKISIRALHERFDRAGFPHIYQEPGNGNGEQK